MTQYLTDLTLRLLSGAGLLEKRRRESIRDFFMAARSMSGGFTGRKGQGDLYYTAFALRGLMLLTIPADPEPLDRLEKFLHYQEVCELSAVELTSLVYCETLLHLARGVEFPESRKKNLADHFEKFRRDDGCFATTTKTSYSSTYQTFLAATAFEVLGEEKRLDSIPTGPILHRQREDGGFVELEKLQHSGTNPTAAALGFLNIRGESLKNREGAVKFLLARQLSDGGFQANTRVPISDLLSSFTALVALVDLQGERSIDLDGLQKFAEKCQARNGGFFGADWDRQSDVEYTFYGLGLLSLLRTF